MAFTNLHCHSEGSILDGAGTAIQRAQRAVELKQSALSITDHGNLILVPDHIDACNEVGIKPIVGMEAYFKPDRTQQDVEHKKAWHLTLLAQNEQGWKNLIKISTLAHQTGFYHNACVDWELLEKYNEGLICSSACEWAGYIPHLFKTANDAEVFAAIERHLEIFGEDRYFMEIMPHDYPEQISSNVKLANLAQKYNVALVATADSHYPDEDWRETRRLLLKMKHIEDFDGAPLHMFSSEEMYQKFADAHPDLPFYVVDAAMKQTEIITDMIEPFEIDSKSKAPKAYSNPNDSLAELIEWCREGMDRIGKIEDEEYEERLDHELQTLKDMGVVDYFVIVGRLVRWAREEGIRISSGRGSAAGSLICYLVRITTIDPIAHELLFERFLNPNRKGLPDIDLDFEHERREEVKAHLAEEYGEDRVADIVALGTYGGKSAIKDMSRVLDVPYARANDITKLIPEAKDVGGAGNIPPLNIIYEQSNGMRDFAKEYPEVWKHALRIEGHIKGIAKHAAGVVLTDRPITDYMPLMRRTGSSDVVTGWSDSAKSPVISDKNFLKLDVLGLDGLSKQGKAIKIIEDNYGKKIDLDALEIARNPKAADDDVLELFRKGQTLGIFQFGGSRGIINFLKHTKPDRFEDLIAVNALFRPGPLDGGDAFRYGDIKQGKEPPIYWHESVRPFLKKTYGLMVYQEQMQQIVQALGEFSPSESDDMRKATSKLYRMGKVEAQQFMSKYHDQWIKGCAHNGLSEEEAEDIWEKLLAFGGYSFNRSHSASYALMAYQDAYLKRKYPFAFYTPLLSSEADLEPVIREAKNIGIDVKTPDINNSDAEFTTSGNELLYGLLSVKYVGDVAVKEIIENRPYKSIEDFQDKVQRRRCGKRVIENLYWSGAFDSLGARKDLTTEQKREFEVESLGVALTGTGDSAGYSDIIQERITSEADFENLAEGTGATVGGEIVSVKLHTIKNGKNKGKNMAFVDISFEENSWDCTFFSYQYNKYESLLSNGNIVLCRGRKSDRGTLIAEQLTTAEELKKVLTQEK